MIAVTQAMKLKAAPKFNIAETLFNIDLFSQHANDLLLLFCYSKDTIYDATRF